MIRISAGRGLLALAAGALLAWPALAKTELTVYTAVEAEDLKRYAEAFNKEHPDIEIKWVRDSTGIVTAKLLAEKDNPQADVIWGLAATSLLLMKAPLRELSGYPAEARIRHTLQPSRKEISSGRSCPSAPAAT